MDVTSMNNAVNVAYDMPAPPPPVVNNVAQSTQTADAPAPPRQASNSTAEKTEKTERAPATMDVIEKTIAQVNRAIAAFDREMHISIHEKTNRIMVKVMDTQENKVIREIPPEKVLDAFARALELAGILIDKKS